MCIFIKAGTLTNNLIMAGTCVFVNLLWLKIESSLLTDLRLYSSSKMFPSQQP